MNQLNAEELAERKDIAIQLNWISAAKTYQFTYPVANAEKERIFFMFWKNETSFQPNLDPSGTLLSILIVKLHLAKRPHAFKTPGTMVKNVEF